MDSSKLDCNEATPDTSDVIGSPLDDIEKDRLTSVDKLDSSKLDNNNGILDSIDAVFRSRLDAIGRDGLVTVACVESSKLDDTEEILESMNVAVGLLVIDTADSSMLDDRDGIFDSIDAVIRSRLDVIEKDGMVAIGNEESTKLDDVKLVSKNIFVEFWPGVMAELVAVVRVDSTKLDDNDESILELRLDIIKLDSMDPNNVDKSKLDLIEGDTVGLVDNVGLRSSVIKIEGDVLDSCNTEGYRLDVTTIDELGSYE